MITGFWEKYGRFAFLGVGFGLVILGLLISWQETTKTTDIEFMSTEESNLAANKEITVYMAGAVNKPGVYILTASSRLHQAIDKAGGVSDQADLRWVEKNLNLARQLADEEKIYIPLKEENVGTSVQGVSGKQFVNLNVASQAELETLPGIGPATAKKIIEYRQENDGFKAAEEIQAVSGIGPKSYEKLKDKITI